MSFQSLLDATVANHHGYAHACHHGGPHFGGIFLGVGLTALVFFLVRGVVRRRRYGGFGRHRGRFLRHLFIRLETSPSQENVIREAIDEVRAAAATMRGEGKSVRDGIGKSLEGEIFDAAGFEAAFQGPESKFAELRAVVAAALAKVHEVLTPNQRKELAAMLSAGPYGFGGGFGHRHHHGFRGRGC